MTKTTWSGGFEDQKKRTMFNPMTDVPESDEQVEVALRYNRSPDVSDNLVGIYRCRRATGSSVLAAFEAVLLIHWEEATTPEARELLRRMESAQG